MKILTLSNSAIVLAALLFLCGCKKENNPEKEEIKPQKIKSIIPRFSFKAASNANFTYAEDGRLRRVDLNTSFGEHDRLEYTYLNGQTKVVTYQVDADVEPWAQRAEIEFVYSGDKLTAVNVTGVRTSIPNISYAFSYAEGSSPSGYTIATWNDQVTIPDVKTYQLTSDSKGNITSSEIDVSHDDLEYDDKPNPLYKLPWVDMVFGNVDHGNGASGNGIVHTFDVEAFFSPNNIRKISRSYEGNTHTTEDTQYSYTEAGQPGKGTVSVSGQYPSKGNIEYLYW